MLINKAQIAPLYFTSHTPKNTDRSQMARNLAMKAVTSNIGLETVAEINKLLYVNSDVSKLAQFAQKPLDDNIDKIFLKEQKTINELMTYFRQTGSKKVKRNNRFYHALIDRTDNFPHSIMIEQYPHQIKETMFIQPDREGQFMYLDGLKPFHSSYRNHEQDLHDYRVTMTKDGFKSFEICYHNQGKMKFFEYTFDENNNPLYAKQIVYVYGGAFNEKPMRKIEAVYEFKDRKVDKIYMDNPQFENGKPVSADNIYEFKKGLFVPLLEQEA